MISIDDLLREDAESWQRGVDDGLGSSHPLGIAVSRSRRTLAPYVTGAVAMVVLVAFSALMGSRALGGSRGTPAGSSHAQVLIGVIWRDAASPGSLTFTASSMYISDGCTRTVHDVTILKHEIVVGPRATLRGMCTGKFQSPSHPLQGAAGRDAAAVARFDEVVIGRLSWVRNGTRLTLSKPSGVSISLTVQSATTKSPNLTAR